MAIELDGKPLKFTAEFDSREAEQNLDSFLKKIQDVNTRGVGNTSAQTAAAKASGQYKSILDDATTAFEAFASKSKDFYAEIAKAELALQKIRNEQSNLNKEFRSGVLNEQDHIGKTTQLNALRDQLTEKIKSNRAELKAFNDDAKKQKSLPFTRQDTLNELANAHATNGSAPLPSLSTSEAFAKANKEAISQLNKELDELNGKLKAGTISNEKYAKSHQDITTKLKALSENEKAFADNVANKGQAITADGEQQKAVLNSVSTEYKKLLSDATSAYSGLDSKTRNLTSNLLKFEAESKSLTAAQKELTESFKNGEITQKQYIESTKALNVQQNAVKGRIAETKRELNTLENVERKTIGSIAEKTAKLTQLKLQYDNLSKSQRDNIAVGGKLRKEYKELRDEIDRLNRSLNGTKSQGVGSLMGSIRGIASSLGIAFGAQQLIAFGRELFDIARQAEGIELRFAKIGDTTGLEKLRAATRGTVSDLELMKLAVNADNFRIPMDVLAKGLEFATRRATETGQSVDYLVNSFVTGLGRKSKLILDNLGISVTELNEEISKTGDFATSVGNIIQREMSKSGNAVDGLADKTNRLSAEWQNFKKSIASGFSAIFNAGAPHASEVEKLTEGFKKNFNAIKGVSKLTRDSFIKDQEAQLLSVNKTLAGLALDKKEFLDIYNAQRGIGGESPTRLLNDTRRPFIEQQQALQASLSYAKGISKEMDIQARQAKNIYSMAEVQEKLDEANVFYKNAVGDGERKKAQIEVEKWQKLYDEMNLKASNRNAKREESAAERLRKEIQRDNDERIKLLDNWSKADADYLNKQLTRDQQEVEAVKHRYAELRKAFEKHNRDTKGKLISLDGLDGSMQNSISAVKDRQATDRRIKLYQEDYQNFSKYESLKVSLGEDVASSQYGKYKDTIDKMSVEYGALISKMLSVGLNPNEAALAKYLSEQLAEVRSRQKEELADTLSSIRTYNQRRLDAERDYQRKYQILEREASKKGNKVSQEQKARLKEELNKELLAITEEQINDNPALANLDSRIDGISSKLAKDAIKLGRSTVNGIIEGLKRDRPELEKQLNELGRVINKQLSDTDNAITEKDYGQIEVLITGFENLVRQSAEFDGNMSSALKIMGTMARSVSELSRGMGATMQGASASLGAVGAMIGAMGTLVELGENYNKRRSEENIEASRHAYDYQIKAMEAVTRQLERQLDLINDIYGMDRVRQFEKVAIDASNALKESVSFFESGVDLKTAEGNDIIRVIKGRENAVKYEYTGVKEYDEIIEYLNQGGVDLVKKFGGSTNASMKKFHDRLDRMLNEGFLTAVKLNFDSIEEITTEDLDYLYKLIDGGRLDDATTRQVQNIIDQYELWKDATNQLREELLGISFKGVLDVTKDLFFNSGEDSASAWQKGFDNIMKDYLKNLFSREFLEGSVQEFYNLYDALAKDGLTDDEKNILQKKWAEIEQEGKKRLEFYEKDLGFSLSDGEDSAVKSESIARQLSESTGSEIVGTFRAGYDIWKRQLITMELQSKTQVSLLQVANDKLLVLNSISTNTANTVQRLDVAVGELQKINKSLGGRYVG